MPSDFTKKAVAWGTAAALGAGALWLAQVILNDDEERPPIIVGNGSVLIGIQEPDKDTDPKGTWERVESSHEWHHAVTNKKPTKSFRAAAYFSTTAGCAKPRKVSEVVMTYVYGQDAEQNDLTDTVRIYVGALGLRMDPGANATVTESGDRSVLTVTRNGEGKLRSVTFDGSACDLPPGTGFVRIQQKKNP